MLTGAHGAGAHEVPPRCAAGVPQVPPRSSPGPPPSPHPKSLRSSPDPPPSPPSNPQFGCFAGYYILWNKNPFNKNPPHKPHKPKPPPHKGTRSCAQPPHKAKDCVKCLCRAFSAQGKTPTVYTNRIAEQPPHNPRTRQHAAKAEIAQASAQPRTSRTS